MIFKQTDWLFHRIAPFYDYLIRPPQVDRLKDLLNLTEDNILLDLGGGTGRVSRHFIGYGTKVVVCDINPSMLKQAKRKKGLILLEADAAQLPFLSHTFDAILVVDALHHFFHPRQVVREMLRVLKPGGRLLIEEQDINNYLIKLIQTTERILGLHSHFLTHDEITAMFPGTEHRLYFEKGSFLTFRILCRPQTENIMRPMVERSSGQQRDSHAHNRFFLKSF